jgi:lysine-specific demethylase/histidyl-hydroxylase NO66
MEPRDLQALAAEHASPALGAPQVLPRFSVDWLLAPVETADFLRHHWETEPLLVSRGRPDHFAGLPGLEAVDELLTATVPGRVRAAGDQRLVKAAARGSISEQPIRLGTDGIVDVQDVYRAYHRGYSLVINRVHQRSAAVSRLCRALEVAFHHPVGANLYLTPRDGQGFLAHVDTHDVFILQLHGDKTWRVAAPPVPLPLASARTGPYDHLGEARELTLRRGDLLYIPRGFPHEATTASTSSLHLTVGVHAFRWSDLMREALALHAAEKVDFRTALPPGFLDAPLDMVQVSELASDFASAVTDSSLMERASARLAARLLNNGKAAVGGHLWSLDALAGLTGDTVLRRAPGQLCTVRVIADEAVIEFPGNYVSGPSHLQPAFEFIARVDRFIVRDLPGDLSTQDQIDLVERLVSEGLLSVQTTATEVTSDGDGRRTT